MHKRISQPEIFFDYATPEIEALNLEKLGVYLIEQLQGIEDICELNQLNLGVEPSLTVGFSLTFISNEEMRAANAEFRGIDKPTDVLSFECDLLDDELDFLDCDDEGEISLHLGDILIATDVALHQCELYNTTLKEEIYLLVVHGFLHLCGYDHIKDEEALVMEGLEKKILQAYASDEACEFYPYER